MPDHDPYNYQAVIFYSINDPVTSDPHPPKVFIPLEFYAPFGIGIVCKVKNASIHPLKNVFGQKS